MSNSSHVNLQRDRKRLMPAGIEHMLVHLTGCRGLRASRLELCLRGAIKRRFEREEPAVAEFEPRYLTHEMLVVASCALLANAGRDTEDLFGA